MKKRNWRYGRSCLRNDTSRVLLYINTKKKKVSSRLLEDEEALSVANYMYIFLAKKCTFEYGPPFSFPHQMAKTIASFRFELMS